VFCQCTDYTILCYYTHEKRIVFINSKITMRSSYFNIS